MSEGLRLVLAVLAVYRLSWLLARDEGPWSVLERLRAELGANDYGPDGRAETWIGRGVTCPLCLGVYLSLLAAAAWLWPTGLGDAVLIWWGIAGGAVAILRVLERIG